MDERASCCTDVGGADGTRVALGPHAPLDLERIFLEQYSALRDLGRGLEPDAVLIAGVDQRGRLVGTHVLTPRQEATGLSHCVVGRHPEVQVRFLMDPAMALRHLLIRTVQRAEGGWDVEVRDLRTGSGFEAGGRSGLEGALARGHVFLRLRGSAVLILPQRTWGGAWPKTAAEAWAGLPKLELSVIRESAEAERAAPVVARRPTLEGESQLAWLPGSALLRPERLAAVVGPVAGTLTLLTEQGFVKHVLSVADLEQGVLLGRYDRCQVGEALGEVQSWSRVHALLVKDGERVLVYDTASTYGTVVDAAHVDRAVLGRHAVITMGPEVQGVWDAVGAGSSPSGAPLR